MDQVFPGIWAFSVSGRARNAPPVEVRLKKGKLLVKVAIMHIKAHQKVSSECI